MTFSTLSQYFEKLEKTSSRLALIDILADLFRQASKSEIEKIIYLTQGRIAPFFEPLEIGMAEKNVASAVGAAFNVDRETVLKLYAKLGDMGLAAEKLRGKGKGERVKVTVSEVFEVLTKIAKTTGEGTVEKRQQLFSNLLKKFDPTSIKHLVRIPLGNLRLGVGDPTILDGLAKAALNAANAKLGRNVSRSTLESAYNRTSDLGLIAKTLFSGGIEAVKRLKVQVGKPIRSELCERLPTPEKVIEKLKEVEVQYKYDGFRVQIHKDGNQVSMFSRNLENMTQMFPELIEGTSKQVKAKTAILDCEALAYNPDSEEFLPFQETTKRRRKYDILEMAKKLPLKAFVFDILYKDRQSLISSPLKKRIEILRKTVKENLPARLPSGMAGRQGGVLIVSQTETVSDPKVLANLLEDAISKGLEGVVVKRVDSPYEAGARNFNWVKLKRHSAGELYDTIDCVILGYIFGRGKRAEFGAGALLVGLYDDKKDEFVTVSKIGTGLSDEEWREIHKRADKIKVSNKPARVNSQITPSVWIKPEIVIEVLADEITRSPVHTAGASASSAAGDKQAGYALRFPRLVSFRGSDKRAEDATTVKEIEEMYKQQSGKGGK